MLYSHSILLLAELADGVINTPFDKWGAERGYTTPRHPLLSRWRVSCWNSQLCERGQLLQGADGACEVGQEVGSEVKLSKGVAAAQATGRQTLHVVQGQV